MRNRNRELWIKVRYRGGPESSWLIETRGGAWRFPGHYSIEEVLGWANGGDR